MHFHIVICLPFSTEYNSGVPGPQGASAAPTLQCYTDLVPLLVVGAAAAEPLLLVAEERGGGEQDDRQHEGEQAAGHHARDVRGPGHQRGGRRDGEGQVSTRLHIVTSTHKKHTTELELETNLHEV